MIRRNTWIILAIFVVLLGGLLYLQKNPLSISESEATPTPTMMVSLLPEKVTSQMNTITYKLNGMTFILKKDEQGNWNTDSEQGETLSSNDASTIPQLLTEAYILQYLTSEPDATSTGLSSPQAEITISDGSTILTTLRIGNPTPTDSGYYVQLDSDPPLVSPKSSISSLLSITPVMVTETVTPTP